MASARPRPQPQPGSSNKPPPPLTKHLVNELRRGMLNDFVKHDSSIIAQLRDSLKHVPPDRLHDADVYINTSRKYFIDALALSFNDADFWNNATNQSSPRYWMEARRGEGDPTEEISQLRAGHFKSLDEVLKVFKPSMIDIPKVRSSAPKFSEANLEDSTRLLGRLLDEDARQLARRAQGMPENIFAVVKKELQHQSTRDTYFTYFCANFESIKDEVYFQDDEHGNIEATRANKEHRDQSDEKSALFIATLHQNLNVFVQYVLVASLMSSKDKEYWKTAAQRDVSTDSVEIPSKDDRILRLRKEYRKCFQDLIRLLQPMASKGEEQRLVDRTLGATLQKLVPLNPVALDMNQSEFMCSLVVKELEHHLRQDQEHSAA
ncbi:hypothetical protein F4780DRAFT_236947 [Xylariomycetidae sp. FL0641]|nr:hypothetical protein F4780DRAFT_236947 [Xylariomycetidae sp. FL0641]